MNKSRALLLITRLVDKFGGNLEGEALEVIRKELEEAQKQSTSSTNTTKAEIAAYADELEAGLDKSHLKINPVGILKKLRQLSAV